MAVIAVTQNARQQVVNVNRSVMVTVDLIGDNFHVYCYIPERGVDIKVVAGQSQTFACLKGESVEIESMGTGTIVVSTVNA